MPTDLFILQVCTFRADGDGYYRVHEPSRQLSRLPGVLVVDCDIYHRFLPNLIRAADVVVLSFTIDWDAFPVFEQRRGDGRVTVYEANDYYLDTHPWNPTSQLQKRSIHGMCRHFLMAADAVQTSTPWLAEQWRKWARHVAVFPNQLTSVPPLSPPPSRPLTIGWGGSLGHLADWYYVAPVLERWLATHPDVHLALMADESFKPLVRLPPERFHFTRGGTLADYLKFLPTLDIGLAPLLPTDYNRGRSDVKFLEYAAHGVAGLYTDLEPYRDSVVPGETGLFFRTSEELVRGLDTLTADANLRQRLRTQAHTYVSQHRRAEAHAAARLAFYQGLLTGPTRGADLAPEVLAAATRDGNYLQLRQGEPERLVIASSREPASLATVQQLDAVVARHPQYYDALLQQGQLLIGAKDYRRALETLERAQALSPSSAAPQYQMALACLGLNDAAGALRSLEEALESNPLYYPAWHRLLSQFGKLLGANGPRRVERAHELFPESYQLALAGAAAFAGSDALRWLGRMIELYAPTLKPDERPAATATFARVIDDITRQLGTNPDVLALLRRACEVFPHSARLANRLGQALRLAGEERESRAHFTRALQLRRTAQLYRDEFPTEDGTLRYWQCAEHIDRWMGR